MRLEYLLDSKRTLVLDGVTERDELLRELSAAAAGAAGLDAGEVERALREREKQAPTSTPEGVAFPHALIEGVGETILVAARAPSGVSMGAPDQPPADIFFCMVGAAEKPWEHVRLLARLARIARGEGALDRIRGAGTPEALHEALVAEDRSHG